MEYLCPYRKSSHGLMNCFPRDITPRDVLLSWEYHSYALSNPYQERHGSISVSVLLVVLQCGQKCAAAGGQLLASLDHVTRPETLESEMPLHWTDAPIKPHGNSPGFCPYHPSVFMFHSQRRTVFQQFHFQQCHWCFCTEWKQVLLEAPKQ